MPAATPPVIPQPFAQSGTRNTIPNTTADTQRASFLLGFPPLTMQPIDAGGKPPLGQDFNGIYWDITSWLYALQGGQLQPFGADIATAISGYGVGALVLMADGAGYWLNTVNSNSTNPDTGGAGWQPVYTYGPAGISGLVGGTRVLTAVEASRYFLVLTGALLANQQIVVPDAYRNYLIVNATTGGFTLTVKTAGGSGVAVPAGGAASPTAVWCDTVNVNPVFVPSALPTSVPPAPATIVLRDNAGRQFAVTAPVNTRSTQVATTEFANPAASLAGNGYVEFPSGLIVQWGFNTRLGSAAQVVPFPAEFPNAVYAVIPTGVRRSGGDALGQVPTLTAAPGLASFTLSHADGSLGSYWVALGR